MTMRSWTFLEEVAEARPVVLLAIDLFIEEQRVGQPALPLVLLAQEELAVEMVFQAQVRVEIESRAARLGASRSPPPPAMPSPARSSSRIRRHSIVMPKAGRRRVVGRCGAPTGTHGGAVRGRDAGGAVRRRARGTHPPAGESATPPSRNSRDSGPGGTA